MSSSFGASIEEAWGNQASITRRQAPGASCRAGKDKTQLKRMQRRTQDDGGRPAQQQQQQRPRARAPPQLVPMTAALDPICDLYDRGYVPALDDVMNQRSTPMDPPPRRPSRPARCAPNPIRQPVDPEIFDDALQEVDDGSSYAFVPVERVPGVPGPSPGDGVVDFYDGWDQDDGAPNGNVAPFGPWEASSASAPYAADGGSQGQRQQQQQQRKSGSAFDGEEDEEDDATPDFDDEGGEGPDGPAGSMLRSRRADGDDDDPAMFDDEASTPPAPKKKKATSGPPSAVAVAVAVAAAPAKVNGTTFAMDMGLYVVSGVILIFLMEQFIQVGVRMR